VEPFRRHDPPKCTQAEFDPPKCTEAEIDPPKGRFSARRARAAASRRSEAPPLRPRQQRGVAACMPMLDPPGASTPTFDDLLATLRGGTPTEASNSSHPGPRAAVGANHGSATAAPQPATAAIGAQRRSMASNDVIAALSAPRADTSAASTAPPAVQLPPSDATGSAPKPAPPSNELLASLRASRRTPVPAATASAPPPKLQSGGGPASAAAVSLGRFSDNRGVAGKATDSSQQAHTGHDDAEPPPAAPTLAEVMQSRSIWAQGPVAQPAAPTDQPSEIGAGSSPPRVINNAPAASTSGHSAAATAAPSPSWQYNDHPPSSAASRPHSSRAGAAFAAAATTTVTAAVAAAAPPDSQQRRGGSIAAGQDAGPSVADLLFAVLDRDGDGVITRDELQEGLGGSSGRALPGVPAAHTQRATEGADLHLTGRRWFPGGHQAVRPGDPLEDSFATGGGGGGGGGRAAAVEQPAMHLSPLANAPPRPAAGAVTAAVGRSPPSASAVAPSPAPWSPAPWSPAPSGERSTGTRRVRVGPPRSLGAGGVNTVESLTAERMIQLVDASVLREAQTLGIVGPGAPVRWATHPKRHRAVATIARSLH
jgi:hypothetical protein